MVAVLYAIGDYLCSSTYYLIVDLKYKTYEYHFYYHSSCDYSNELLWI